MKPLKFTKMHGAGNDFIVIDNREDLVDPRHYSDLAERLCDRRLSVGADGLMVVEPSEEADLAMQFFNADGSRGEMCGNGARCICRYAYEKGMASTTQRVLTTAGVVYGERVDEKRYRIRLNDPSVIRLDQQTTIQGRDYHYDYVELGDPGVPHLCVRLEGLAEYPEEDLFNLGKTLRYLDELPKGANVNFYDVMDDHHLVERTWERGVEGFTLACGTGTASVALARRLKGESTGDVEVHMPGGTLVISTHMEGDELKGIYLEGPTAMVFEGEILEDII